MALRAGHGNGAGVPRIEVKPADELPTGIRETERPEGASERDSGGRWRKGSRTAQSRGGKALKSRTALSHKLGLGRIEACEDFRPFLAAANAFSKAQRAHLASTVGGGVCGPGPSSIVQSAAMQLAASQYLYAEAAALGDAEMLSKASRLADASRQNLLAAHELCAREAESRPRGAVDPLAAFMTDESDKGSDAK